MALFLWGAVERTIVEMEKIVMHNCPGPKAETTNLWRIEGNGTHYPMAGARVGPSPEPQEEGMH